MTQPKIDGTKHGQPRTIFGSDGTDWYALLVDALGHLQVDVVTVPGINSYLNIPFGYNDRLFDRGEVIGVPAGHWYFFSGPVPPGEIWVVHSLSAVNWNNPKTIEMGVGDGATWHRLNQETQTAMADFIYWNGLVLLKQGDQVRIIILDCTLNDNVEASVWGYKMKVTQ
uniref:Uncharacterized protein n=1 Tax=viral metagenome TaxID=1070528 RepID=A0A6M3XVP8_9ZZZZ